jgi:hypothetical protein
MKKQNTIILFAFVAAIAALANVQLTFSNWNFLINSSPNIIIGRCIQTPDYERDRGSGPTGTLYFSQIEVVSILKGAGVTNYAGGVSKLGTSRLVSDFYPRQGEYYLVFSIFHDGGHQASESYRVVPIGLTFNTNSLSGKNLDEQIQMLLQRRLDNLNRQMKQDQEEKVRLEQAFHKSKP